MRLPRFINGFVDLLLRSDVFVAACAVALAWETTLLAGVPARPVAFYAFVFCATWASYRLHAAITRMQAERILPRHERPARESTLSRTGFISAGIAFAFTLVLLPIGTRVNDLPMVALASLLAVAYSIPAFPNRKALREFGLIKIAVLAGVWTLVTAYLPATGAAGTTVAYVCVRRFLFMFALCVAFDVRDASADERGGIRTVAVLLGTRASYRLMRVALLAFAALVLLGPAIVTEPLARQTTIALLASAAITWLAIEQTRRPTTTRRFYLGCVDGMMLVQCLLVTSVTRMR